jgi:hypothetical protein
MKVFLAAVFAAAMGFVAAMAAAIPASDDRRAYLTKFCSFHYDDPKVEDFCHDQLGCPQPIFSVMGELDESFSAYYDRIPWYSKSNCRRPFIDLMVEDRLKRLEAYASKLEDRVTKLDKRRPLPPVVSPYQQFAAFLNGPPEHVEKITIPANAFQQRPADWP